MAKKKLKEPKEVFKEPEFDEVDFMRTEIEGAKAGITTVVYAVPVAIVSFLLSTVGLAVLGFVVGIFSMFTLRFVYTKLGINVKGFDRKAWAGNGALMFFSWLIIWILLLNPPFSDSADPGIGNVELWVQGSDGNWTLNASADGDFQSSPIAAGTTIKIRANITDNIKLSSVTVTTLMGNSQVELDMNRSGAYADNYEFKLELAQSASVIIKATDGSGHWTDVRVEVPTA